MSKNYFIAVEVENNVGVLPKILGLFSGKGYNIESVSANVTGDKTSTIYIRTFGDEHVIEQIIKQLRKFINVLHVRNVTSDKYVLREMGMFKVGFTGIDKLEVLEYIKIFGGKIIDIDTDYAIIEIIAKTNTVDKFHQIMRQYNLLEFTRSGFIGVLKSVKNTM